MATGPFADSKVATATAVKEETTAALPQVGNHFPVDKEPAQLDNEQLATLVADGAIKLAVFSEALKPYYLELRKRFHDKKSKTTKIHGCATWDDYCEKVLDRCRRAVNYWLAGGNPGNEKAKRERKARGTEASTSGAPAPENGKPSFAIAHSPIDGDAAWSKQDTSRQILAWSLSCLKNFSAEEKREIAQDVTAKLRDEMEFEVPQPPPIAGNPVPEPEPGTLEELRQRLSRMADTEEMSKALAKFVTDLLTPVLANHPYSPSHRVSVAISRKDKRRVDVGDWVGFVGGRSERLLKLIGEGKLGLGRVVGEDEFHRPRVRWHDGREWKKPYSLFENDGRVHVLYGWQAVERYPEAFKSYPSDAGGKTVPPKPPTSVDAPVTSTVSTNEEAVLEVVNEQEGCGITPTSSPLVLISSGSEATEESVETGGIKGCTYIYAPKGQAGEYAPLACNPYRGCGHKCAYCYVPHVLKMKREEFDSGAVPRPDFLRNLEKDAAKYREAGYGGQVMLSFTTDPFHLGDTTLTRQTIECLQRYGMGVCTLTKGGTRSLRDLDLFRPSRDAFASTLTSLDDAFSLKWERDAALPGDRIEALKAFHDRGVFTWVSLEPTLDCESSLEIVERTHEYVDLYKIGRANYLPMTKTTDWKDYTERMMELCAKLKVTHYFKKDLQQYLPAGYVNVLRHQQHH